MTETQLTTITELLRDFAAKHNVVPTQEDIDRFLEDLLNIHAGVTDAGN